MKITHWGISYFRSIGEKPVMLDLTKKINVLVGANNAGKSNVLRGLAWYGDKKIREGNFKPIDHHQRKDMQRPRFSLRADCDMHAEEDVRSLGAVEITYDGHIDSVGEAYASNLESVPWELFNRLYRFTGNHFNRRVDGDSRRKCLQ